MERKREVVSHLGDGTEDAVGAFMVTFFLLSTAKEKKTLCCKDGCNRKLLVSDRRKGGGRELAGPSVTYFPLGPRSAIMYMV